MDAGSAAGTLNRTIQWRQRFLLEVCQEVQHRHSFGPLLESRKKTCCSAHLFLYFTLDLQSCCVALPVNWRGVPHLYHTLHECVLTRAAKVTLEGVMKQPLKQAPPLMRLIDSNAHVGRCVSLCRRAVCKWMGRKQSRCLASTSETNNSPERRGLAATLG